MSVPHPPEHRDPCAYCGGTVPEAREDSHCSDACHYRDRGAKLLRTLRSDHQICATCFGRVKTVEPIHKGPESVTEGLQFQTEHTTIGVDVFESESPSLATPIEATRWSCECGAVDPSTLDADIQRLELTSAITNCFHALQYLYRRDKAPNPPSRQAYLDAIRANEFDARLAVGRAIYE